MEGKIITITGAGSGLARATALRCAELGAGGLSLCDINFESLEETEKLINAKYKTKIVLKKVDVTIAAQVDEWISECVKEFGRLDASANVAGIGPRTKDTTTATLLEEHWDKTIAVNLTGVMHCMRAQLNAITRPGGSIVNVSSGAGLRGVYGFPHYVSSKWGMRGLAQTAAIEFGAEGIRVNTLLPGVFNTGPNFESAVAAGLVDVDALTNTVMLKRLGKVEECAKVMTFLLSDDASYVTGAEWAVDGGFHGGLDGKDMSH